MYSQRKIELYLKLNPKLTREQAIKSIKEFEKIYGTLRISDLEQAIIIEQHPEWIEEYEKEVYE
jgi:hypothetical protein